MRLGEAWRVAVTALRANRLRSALTMLGVIIGVSAVVMLVAIGTGAKEYVESQVQGLGSNLLLVVPGEISFGSAPTSSRLTLADVDEIARVAGDRQRVAATVTSGETLRAGNNELFATVQGVDRDGAGGVHPAGRAGRVPAAVRCGHPPAGGGARRVGGRHRCSATGTRSAGR